MDDTVGVRMQTRPDPVVGFPWYDSSHPCDAAGVCSPNQVDSYFFGHGHRYRDAMRDFALVSGKAALPPRVAFGVWWSTWYNFTSYELTHTILEKYKEHGLPLDVVVMDMEWHTVHAPPFHPSMTNCTGWGGYTWNTQLIPDPLGFQVYRGNCRPDPCLLGTLVLTYSCHASRTSCTARTTRWATLSRQA
jgi:hypothetical protein